jgi:hypothetical protein
MDDPGGINAMTVRFLPAVNLQVPTGIPIIRPRSGLDPVAARPVVAADEALTRLYDEYSRPMLGLAALLVWVAVRPGAVPLVTGATATGGHYPYSASGAGARSGEFATIGMAAVPDVISGIAEEVLHDAFAAMHREWRRLRDADRAIAYLRHAIVHGTRACGRPVAGHDGEISARAARVLTAVRRLPGRQREALVLRYYADLPEAQAAAAMGITRAAFRGHAARGMAALRGLMDQLSSTVSTVRTLDVHGAVHRYPQPCAQGVHSVFHTLCTPWAMPAIAGVTRWSCYQADEEGRDAVDASLSPEVALAGASSWAGPLPSAVPGLVALAAVLPAVTESALLVPSAAASGWVSAAIAAR